MSGQGLPLTAAATFLLVSAGCGPTAPATLPAGTGAVVPSPTAASTVLSTPVVTPTAAPVSVPGSLGEVMAFVSADTRSVAFTDWRAIKAANGGLDVTSASTRDEKLAAVQTLIGKAGTPPTDAAAAGFALPYLLTGSTAAAWGFDVMDLDWEAQIVSRGIGWVLRLREGFDSGPLHARMDAYGFSTEKLAHGTLRAKSTPRAFTLKDASGNQVPYMITVDPAIVATGFLDDGRTLVMGYDPLGADPVLPFVRSMLTAGPPNGADPILASVAAALDGPTAAILDRGFNCNGLDEVGGGDQAAVDAAIQRAGVLGMWSVVAVAYDRADTPSGRFVFGYGDPALAAVDLAARRSLAETAPSLRFAGQTYGDMFTVADARVDGSTIVLEVAPARDTPQRLFMLLQRRDLLFGVCGK